MDELDGLPSRRPRLCTTSEQYCCRILWW